MVHDVTSELYPLHLTVARLYTDRAFQGNGGDLRRAVTALFPDLSLLHHHGEDGRPDYSMPAVRYLVLDHVPHLVGIGEGRNMVVLVAEKATGLSVGKTPYSITGSDFIEDGIHLGISVDLTSYTSVTPWLALNQPNTKEFHNLHRTEEKHRLLERILTGNFLSLAKGLDVRITGRVLFKVTSFHTKRVSTPNPMLGFRISFVSNIVLPEFLGLGKMVSKGLGLMRRKG